MIEQRKVRFSSIEGIDREDLPLACEVWLDDLYHASWVTREAMKLGNQLMRYMCRPDPSTLSLREIESQYQLNHEEVRKALSLMRTFGVAENFFCDRTDLKVALNLTVLQRLRVLEAKHRFGMLAQKGNPRPWTAAPDKWLVPEAEGGERRPVRPS